MVQAIYDFRLTGPLALKQCLMVNKCEKLCDRRQLLLNLNSGVANFQFTVKKTKFSMVQKMVDIAFDAFD